MKRVKRATSRQNVKDDILKDCEFFNESGGISDSKPEHDDEEVY